MQAVWEGGRKSLLRKALVRMQPGRATAARGEKASWPDMSQDLPRAAGPAERAESQAWYKPQSRAGLQGWRTRRPESRYRGWSEMCRAAGGRSTGQSRGWARGLPARGPDTEHLLTTVRAAGCFLRPALRT